MWGYDYVMESGWVGEMGLRVVVLKFGCDLLQMRGLDWLVSSDNTVVLRLGLLGHILDLRKFRIFVLSCIGCVNFSFPFVSSSLSFTHDDFLLNYEFGSVLRGIKGGEAREFRRRCPDFIDRFVEIILAQYPASSDLMRCIYCFCPELLLEGGDEYIFGLFNCLVALLKRCKVLTDVEAGAATEEFLSFVVDVLARHDTGAQHAEEIPDMVAFPLADYSFLARKSLCRVFKLCCLVVVKPRRDSPVVDIDLSGCTVP